VDETEKLEKLVNKVRDLNICAFLNSKDEKCFSISVLDGCDGLWEGKNLKNIINEMYDEIFQRETLAKMCNKKREWVSIYWALDGR